MYQRRICLQSVISTLSLFILFSSVAFADTGKTRPTVGLVLKGGGALGFAHVGVLRVLEQNHIPIDYIAGTSMGAIVGAAYASGQTVEVMEEVLSTTDWDALFVETPPRAKMPYRRKPGRNREIFGSARVGLQDGQIVTPSALITGQRILPVLQRLYEHAPTQTDFDDLPIPFRAVTADLENGQPVILDHGNLALATRASMGVPGFFTAVEIDGRVLVDGGIVFNLPVGVALDMGADILIVIDIRQPFRTRDELRDPLSISSQILGILLEQNSDAQRKLIREQDVVVIPDLREYGSMAFSSGQEIMAAGEAAANAVLPELQKLAVSEEEYQRFREKRERTAPETPIIAFIDVVDTSHLTPKYIKKSLKTQVGEPFDREQIEKDIERLHRQGSFREVRYELKKRDGQYGLEITATDKEWYRRNLRAGLSIESESGGGGRFGLGLSYRANALNRWGAQAEISGQVGDTSSIFLEWYQPLGTASPWFLSPAFDIAEQNLLVRQGQNVIAEYERSKGLASLRFGREISTLGEAYVAYGRGWGKIRRRIGDPELPQSSFDIGDLWGHIVLDTLDSPDFPRKGFITFAEGRLSRDSVGASADFEQANGFLLKPFTYDRHTLLVSGEGGWSSDEMPPEFVYTLGGLFDVSGYSQDSLIASEFAVGRLRYSYQLAEIGSKLFGVDVFGGASVEAGTLRNTSEQLKEVGSVVGGSIYLGIDTPLIPIYLGYGHSDQGTDAFYIRMGRLQHRRGF